MAFCTQSIYIDGVLDNQRACSSQSIDFVGSYDNDTVSIGRLSRAGEPPAWQLEGSIDDVRIYDRALSGGEIEALYGAVEPPDGDVY